MIPNREPNKLHASASALALLDQFAITVPQDIQVHDLATARGAVVIEAPLEGCEARLVRSRTRGVIRVRSSIQENGRKRFAAAHELGHFLLHADVSQYFICTAEDMRDYRRSPVEIEANFFASHLLMPSFLFRPRCRKRDANLTTVSGLATEFDTSLTATALRFVEESGHLCTAVLSRDGSVEWAKSTEGRRAPRIERGQRISPDALAYHCTVEDQLSPWQEVPAVAWFEEPADARRWEVMEQSLRFRGYPFILTLLCLTEREDEPEDAHDRFAQRNMRRGVEDS